MSRKPFAAGTRGIRDPHQPGIDNGTVICFP